MQIFCLFCKKKPTFSILPSTFTKHPYQFIYSTHLFNKIFILFTFFVISFPLLSRDSHPATVFFVKLQTQHKPKITHTQPPSSPSSYRPNINPKSPTPSHQPPSTIKQNKLVGITDVHYSGVHYGVTLVDAKLAINPNNTHQNPPST